MEAFQDDRKDREISESLAIERRTSPRVACTLETKCQAVADARSKAWPARAVDLSTGGIALVLGRRFEPGAMLSTCLASADGETERTMFLRVVHVARQQDGTWRHGCAFAGELTPEEIRGFQVEAIRPETPDRRAWVRVTCNVRTECRVATPAQPDTWPTRVLEVSPGGVSLLAPFELEQGMILDIKLP